MTATEIVRELEALGAASYKKVLLNHGAREPIFGVKIEELKKIRKRTGTDHLLALDLFATGIYDAQYLAGLVADPGRMTADDLQRWLATSNCRAISATTVAWVAAESPHGRELAMEWLASPDEDRAQAGWAALSSLVAISGDSRLKPEELERLLQLVERTIHQQPNYVRYSMNGFVIALGSYVDRFTDAAILAGERIGPVSVDMGNTACAVPYAPAYIEKVRSRGAVGKTRKRARC